jgi:hypothetical protein
LEALTSGKFIVGMALTLDALKGSLRQLTKLGEGGHALISGNFGPLLEQVYDLINIMQLNRR